MNWNEPYDGDFVVLEDEGEGWLEYHEDVRFKNGPFRIVVSSASTKEECEAYGGFLEGSPEDFCTWGKDVSAVPMVLASLVNAFRKTHPSDRGEFFERHFRKDYDEVLSLAVRKYGPVIDA